MRLFVAVDVPEELKARVESEIVEVLRPKLPGARWTRPEGRHLTLKFLGNVDDDRRADIEAVVADVASLHERSEAAFEQVGAFPDLRRPRVLWVGVASETLARVAADLESGFEPLGFEREDRPFRGHLTLARFPKPARVELPELEVPAEPFVVGELILFRSQLHPKGARYTALRRFALDA